MRSASPGAGAIPWSPLPPTRYAATPSLCNRASPGPQQLLVYSANFAPPSFTLLAHCMASRNGRRVHSLAAPSPPCPPPQSGAGALEQKGYTALFYAAESGREDIFQARRCFHGAKMLSCCFHVSWSIHSGDFSGAGREQGRRQRGRQGELARRRNCHREEPLWGRTRQLQSNMNPRSIC
jgi:hypothetical protein